MNLVDSCGWLEYFAAGPNADFFAPAIEDTSGLIVPTICLFEVFKRIAQQRNENDAMRAIGVMRQSRCIDLDDSQALGSARLSLALKLPLADSIILHTAREYGAALWTQDAHFAGLDGVRYLVRAEAH